MKPNNWDVYVEVERLEELANNLDLIALGEIHDDRTLRETLAVLNSMQARLSKAVEVVTAYSLGSSNVNRHELQHVASIFWEFED